MVTAHWFHYLIWACGFCSFLVNQATGTSNLCAQRFAAKNRQLLDVYWINMDISKERKGYMMKMNNYFGLHNSRRFSAITPADIVFPTGFEKATDCRRLSANETVLESQRIQLLQKGQKMDRAVLLASHCGKDKNNFQNKHLSLTLSHLIAIYEAVHNDPNSTAQYALIMEDDLRMALEIDFEQLIETAPPDFAILQLLTSNEVSIEYAWDKYLHGDTRWLKRGEFDASWCTGAYLVHKERLKPIISRIIQKISDQLYIARIEAVEKKCPRTHCCSEWGQLPQSPCIVAPYGYESDNFIYNLLFGQSYVTTIPFFLTSEVADISMMHQEHVTTHQSAFKMIKNLIEFMLVTERHLLPSFLNSACVEECHPLGIFCRNHTSHSSSSVSSSSSTIHS
jgi:hypothetical protein